MSSRIAQNTMLVLGAALTLCALALLFRPISAVGGKVHCGSAVGTSLAYSQHDRNTMLFCRSRAVPTLAASALFALSSVISFWACALFRLRSFRRSVG